ncbi:Fe(2+) transporter [Cryptotrichosporon argae]
MSSAASSSTAPPALSAPPPPPPPQAHFVPHGAHLDLPEDDDDYEALPAGYGWGVNMAAGAMAGISEHAAIFPVDSIKTRMQVLPSLSPSVLLSSATPGAPSAGSAARAAAAAPLTTFSQHLRSVRVTEGIRSLWRGVASVILGAGPAHAAHFGMYEYVREISGGHGDGWSGVAATALAGATASITSDAFMNPFDVIKQRMQIRNSPHRTVLSCARAVYASEGLAAFYVSYPTTITMSVPFTAVQFSVYESLKTLINPDGGYSPGTHVAAGGAAGAVAAAVTTPLDVAKTLLQTRGSSTDARIRNARGMSEALKIIVERDGLRGLRRGLVPRVMTVAPSTAISWLSYEFFKVLIRQGGHLPETGSHA